MGVIKSISIYNGSNWGEPENIGADAANVSLSQNVWGTKNLDTVITSFFPSSTIAGGLVLSLNGTTGKLQSTGITASQINANFGYITNLLTDVSALKTDASNNNQITFSNTVCAGTVTGSGKNELVFFLPYSVTGGTTASLQNLSLTVRTSYPRPGYLYVKANASATPVLLQALPVLVNGSAARSGEINVSGIKCFIRKNQGFYINIPFSQAFCSSQGNDIDYSNMPVTVTAGSGGQVGIIIS